MIKKVLSSKIHWYMPEHKIYDVDSIRTIYVFGIKVWQRISKETNSFERKEGKIGFGN